MGRGIEILGGGCLREIRRCPKRSSEAFDRALVPTLSSDLIGPDRRQSPWAEKRGTYYVRANKKGAEERVASTRTRENRPLEQETHERESENKEIARVMI